MNLFDDLEETIEEDIEIKNINIKLLTSKKLCQIIISCRYLKINNELYISCMEELSKRRVEGDNFDFECYIEENSKDLPTLNFSIPNFKDLLNQALKK